MADVRSKNLYELLGNDPEFDPNRPPAPPTKAVDKTAARHGKREGPNEPAVSQPRVDSNRRGGRATGNEAAFRDRNAGRTNNREKPVDETGAPTRRGGDRRRNTDRQSRTGQTDTRKQVNQGWGNQSGEKTLDDEKAGEDIAQKDENEPQTPAEDAEPADKSMSFADYLAEKAQQEDLRAKAVRAANEGVKADKKWAAAKELKVEDEASYIQGKEVHGKREKQRKEKNFLDVDMRFVEAPRTSSGPAPRGGAGPRGRGGRGRGEGRGGARGRGEGGRGEGARGSGAPRAGGPPRAAGPRAAGPAPVAVDEKNFPSLGAK